MSFTLFFLQTNSIRFPNKAVNLKHKKVVSNFLLSTLWNEHAHGVCLDRVFIKVDWLREQDLRKYRHCKKQFRFTEIIRSISI